MRWDSVRWDSARWGWGGTAGLSGNDFCKLDGGVGNCGIFAGRVVWLGPDVFLELVAPGAANAGVCKEG